MNKEEDYRNLAGNITMFTDNTSFYEDWLVIQQYVDDWLDEIDNLQQEKTQLKSVLKEIREYVKKKLELFPNGLSTPHFEKNILDELLEIIDKSGIGE